MPNLHPLLVHFPIGLLTIYALLECMRFKRILRLPYWFYVKGVLVIVGTVASYPTLLTGTLIAPLLQGSAETSALILRHSQWAFGTVLTFTLLMLAYLFGWIKREGWGIARTGILMRLRRGGIKYSDAILETAVLPLLALFGLFAVTLAGALGGSIVYGPDVDPFVKVIYGVFGPK